MEDDKFHARLQQIARKAGFSIKHLSFRYVAGEVRKRRHDDAAPPAILAAMKDVRLLKPDQFGTATAMLNFENSTAMERLEAANQQMAAQREEEKRVADMTKPRVTLTARELALPPDTRLSVYEEKLAAAIAAKKNV